MHKPPLIGRKVRFEGKYRGLEGIVLEVVPEVYKLHVWLEVTSYGPHGVPPEADGARPIQFLVVSADVGSQDRMFVVPGPDGETIAKAAADVLDKLDAWRTSRWTRDAADRVGLKHELFKARSHLETLLGRPITHPEGPPLCKFCQRVLPEPGTSRICSRRRDSVTGDYLTCEGVL